MRLYDLSYQDPLHRPADAPPPATQKQVAFIISLAARKGRTFSADGAFLQSEDEVARLTRRQASTLIDELLVLGDMQPAPESQGTKGPANLRTATEQPSREPGLSLSGLTGGYYAARLGDVTKFFKIDVVAEGKWAGWVFVKIQASDDLHRQGSQKPGQAYRGASADYLAEITRDGRAAMELYGQHIGRCGHCGRTLTDETSRARGIGPVCAEKMGW